MSNLDDANIIGGAVTKETWETHCEDIKLIHKNGLLSGKGLSQNLGESSSGNWGRCEYDPYYSGLTNGNGLVPVGRYLTLITGGLIKSKD
jgi:hypothetical protein